MTNLVEEYPVITLLSQLIKQLDPLWVKQIARKAWNYFKGLLFPHKYEGMYEVLEYSMMVELCDPEGKKARVSKTEKVRYLQNNIIAFQDQAWGDGKILLDYRCSPGKPVDRYRWGYKHHILISLGQVKSRGDIDEFHITWAVRNGFLSPTGFWATEINHPTQRAAVQIIFPSSRPLKSAVVLEKNRQKTTALGKEAIKRLRGGNLAICWEKNAPRRYEQYILKWEW